MSQHSKSKKNRHSRSKKKIEERRRRWFEPDPKEQKVRELNRLMRQEIERAPESDGEISGPLSVVARYATPQLLEDFNLDKSHTMAFEHWLMAKFGDILRQPDVAGYLAWRETCNQVDSDALS